MFSQNSTTIFQDPVDLGWKPYVKTWLNKLPRDLPESGKNFLQALFDSSMDKGLAFLHKYREHQAVEVPAMSIVGTLCHILSAYITFLGGHGGYGAAGIDNLLCGYMYVSMYCIPGFFLRSPNFRF